MYRDYYTVDRSPQEVAALWDWASEECRGKLPHETPYAFGVLAALEYLMGETEDLPQSYHGLFTLNNVLRQRGEKRADVGNMGNPNIDEPLHNSFQGLRPGNPKTLLYDPPLVGNGRG